MLKHIYLIKIHISDIQARNLESIPSLRSGEPRYKFIRCQRSCLWFSCFQGINAINI
ncbi:hypothetical protein HanRHA438_Chr14g0655911 [Helianthus annuus]|nr:hypothetical protein HanRHA438_Chr14g0655911 [Helianthus annuus]